MAVFLTAVMLLTAAPLSGFVGLDIDFGWLDFSTKASALSSSGSCGDNVTYTFDSSTGLLTISGTGDMKNYNWFSSPFYNNSSIKNVVISDGVISIGNSVFYGCRGLTSIIIPDSVTSIGDYAFYGCTGLKNIIIPDSVISIGKSVFCECRGLKSITIPDSVTSIGENAFGCCTSLTNVTSLGNINSIGDSAFYNCTSLTSIEIPDSVTSIGNEAFKYCDSLTSITIPKGVTSIANNAFSCCTSLTNVTSLGSINSIGDSVFYNCTSLTSIEIPDSVTSIENEAFKYCDSLTSITIPKGVTSIANNAFNGCTALTNFVVDKSNNVYDSRNNCNAIIQTGTNTLIQGCKNTTIPYGVKSIGDSAFYNCTSLTSITIPDSVTSIGDYAFYCCNGLKELSLPCSTKIYNSENTFYKCLNIEKIILTKGMGVMQSHGNSSDSSNTTYYQYTPWYISRNNIKELYIEDGVTTISDYAFKDCTGLTSITISDSVTSIGNWAFRDCTGLTSVTIPNSVTNISDYAFSNCNNVYLLVYKNSFAEQYAISNNINYSIISKISDGTDMVSGKVTNTFWWSIDVDTKTLTIDVDGYMAPFENDIAPWEQYKEYINHIVINDGCTNIGKKAFMLCDNAESVIIPDSVTYIDDYAFYGCTRLKELTMPCSVKICNSEYTFKNCLHIKKFMFTKGTGAMQDYGSCYQNTPWYINSGVISEVVFEYGVTNIGNWLFYNCTGLTNVSIPNSVTSIGHSAFRGCINLTSVIVPNSVTKIANYAFSNCVNLTSINLPDRLTSINNSLFYGCSSLTNLTIPNGVTSIGENAFYGCNNLISLTLPNGLEIIGNDAFNRCTSIYLFVFKDSYSEQYAIDNSLNYRTISKISDDVNVVHDKVTNKFSWSIDKSNSTLTIDCIGIMPSLEEDDAPWLQYKEYIRHIIINDGCTNVSERVFMLCDKVESVIIPDSVTSISNYAFYNCYNLKEISLPCSAKIYNSEYTFYKCKNIEKVTLTKGTGVMQDYGTSTGTSSSTTHYQYTPWYISRENIKEIVFEDGVQNIGSYAFYSCTGLTSITIPDSVTSIGWGAFRDCTGLTSVTIPDSVTSIGNDAFKGCCSLTSIAIPDSVTSFGTNVLTGCTNLTIVEIGIGVTQIHNSEFDNLISLKNVTIGSGVKSIGANAFSGCTGLTSITIPNSVTAIGDCAFSGCTGLTGIIIPDSVTSYGTNVLTGCSNLTYIDIGDCIKKINDFEFENFKNLKGVTFGLGIRKIGNYAFNGCTALEEIVIPYNVNSIGANAFKGCKSLDSLTVYNRNCTFGDNVTAYYTTIYGFTGSTSETYANEKGFDFVAIDDTHTHVYDDANDKTCNLCGADRTVCEHPSTHIEHKDSTCTEHGYDKSICDICGATVSITELPYKHDYVATVTAPTCTEQGYTTYTCSLCGDSYTVDYTEPLNHPHKTWRVTKNPTATSTGLMTETCDLCGAQFSEMEIPMLIPNYVTGITVSPNKLALNVGDTANLTAVITPDTAENKNVIWSSSDTDIATVADGVVTAKTPGVAMIIVQSEDGGYKDFCVVRVASLTPVNGAVVDNENGLIYGIASNSADINSYVNTVDDTMTVECDSALLGTGSVVNIVKDDVIVDSYKIVLFGDVNGDGWYDGMDAVTVSCIANGMLTKDQIGEAAYMAADCNHDGVVDEFDVALLNQAGVLLANVDQTKTQEELAADSDYVEYLNLIDQNPTVEEEPEKPEQDNGFIAKLIAFIETILKYIVTLVNKIC